MAVFYLLAINSGALPVMAVRQIYRSEYSDDFIVTWVAKKPQVRHELLLRHLLYFYRYYEARGY